MFYKLIAFLALPLLIVQGKQVRKQALKLPEAIGAREGSTENSTKPPLSILILGDSSAAGVGATHQNEALLGQLVHNLQNDFDLSWTLVAKTGARTQDMITMLELAASTKEVDIVITSLGVNDVTSLQRTADWLSAQEKLHQYCFNKLGAKHIIVSGMPPMYKFPLLPQPLRWVMGSRAKQFDRLQAIAIGKYNSKSYEPLLFELDQGAMAIDGFHPGPLIYRALAESLSERIIYIAKSRFF